MKKTILMMTLVLFAVSVSSAATFRFKHRPRRQYRVKNTVSQDLYQNGAYLKTVRQLSKTVFEVLENRDRAARIKARHSLFEKSDKPGEPYLLKDGSEFEFTWDSQGRMTVAPDVLALSLRSVPAFPERDLQPGDSWTAEGEEVHAGVYDRSNTIRLSFDVFYKYFGKETVNNRSYAKMSVDYHVIHHQRLDPNLLSLSGYSHRLLYWDPKTSAPAFHNENYAFLMTMRNGDTYFIRGTAESRWDDVIDMTNEMKEQIAARLSNTITADSGMSVRGVPDGIVVNLDNILFEFNRDALMKSYEKKLQSVAAVLVQYPAVDLQVSGYTDNVGSDSYNRVLSEKRARNVAAFLIRNGVGASRVSYAGYGKQKPIADNATDQGRQKNRRVEIKLLLQE